MEDLICLDTDILIDYLKGKGAGVSVFEEVVKKTPCITQINRFQLLCGARNQREINIINDCLSGFIFFSFDDKASYESSRIYRELKTKGNMIGMGDIMIAGIVLANKIQIATKNIKDFARIKGIKIFK